MAAGTACRVLSSIKVDARLALGASSIGIDLLIFISTRAGAPEQSSHHTVKGRHPNKMHDVGEYFISFSYMYDHG